MNSLHKLICKEFPYLNFCLWNTKWLNEFMLHQPGRFYQFVETDKDATDAVFYFLKEQRKDVYLSPSQDILSQYASDKREIIIVSNLVSEAPLQIMDEITVPTLEKILVDIFCDDHLLAAFQGAEMKQIFTHAFEEYTVEVPKLLRYAERRKRRSEIKKYISNIYKGSALIKKSAKP